MGGLLRAEDGEHILNYGTYSYILSVCCNHGSVTTLVDIVLATLLDFTIGACIRTLNHSFLVLQNGVPSSHPSVRSVTLTS